jgi:sugar-specific transcriptional regulator TrmB
MAFDSEVLNLLRQLGLNQYESKAYYALSHYGSHTAGELSERAELPRPRIYDVLTRLQDKGFVAIQQGRPVRYVSLPISEAVKTVKKQREAGLLDELKKCEELGKELQTRIHAPQSLAPSEETVWTLRGREAIYSKMASMISAAKKNVTISSDAEGIMRKLRQHGKELEKAKSRGAKVSIIAPVSSIPIDVPLLQKEMPSRLLLADDQALVFLSAKNAKPEDEMGIWLKSPHFVETIKHALK